MIFLYSEIPLSRGGGDPSRIELPFFLLTVSFEAYTTYSNANPSSLPFFPGLHRENEEDWIKLAGSKEKKEFGATHKSATE